jgi:uncharacterized membrane protein YeaQ/YmgE (transglycosylase-associated protein family)
VFEAHGVRATTSQNRKERQRSVVVAEGREDVIVGILGWIVLGLIAGAIAKAIMPGKDPGGIIIRMQIGIVGAILGGFIGRALFNSDINNFFDLSTWLLAILGSLVLLGIYRLVTGRRAHA